MRTVDRRTDNPRRRRNWFGCTDDMPLWTRPDVLTFSTEPRDEAVEVVGDMRVVLYASPAAVDTDSWFGHDGACQTAPHMVGLRSSA
jgi:predicted acyl esterase